MRHGKKFNHLGRKAAHRRAMLANMACSLIEHKRIKTTLAKAKALRKYVEPIITKSKLDTTHSRRVVFSYLQNKHMVKELFGEVAVKVAERPGGYTRILKVGPRSGDNAEMALIELVDYNELAPGKAASVQEKKKKRRRRGKKKGSSEDQEEIQDNNTNSVKKEVEKIAAVSESQSEEQQEEQVSGSTDSEAIAGTEANSENTEGADTDTINKEEDDVKEENEKADEGSEEEKKE